MSGYHGRRGPNVAGYLADLNTIPTAQDLQQAPNNFDEDVALFTNLGDFDFGDFDNGDIGALMQSPVEYDQAQEERVRRQNASAYRQKQDNFMNSGDFAYPGFNFSDLVDPAVANFTPAANSQQQFSVPTQHSSPSATSPTSPTDASVSGGSKRKLDSFVDPDGPGMDDVSRMAAEEDKRRRNTAASARFRIKKKQREQALEKAAKEMTDKVTKLENRITTLETENRWLKNLLTEKNDTTAAELSKAKLVKSSTATRSLGDHTTGVGTEEMSAKA